MNDMDKTLIERAIDSAKHRQYKLSADLKRDISSGHRKKAEKQREVAEVTVQALERMLPKKPDRIEYKLERECEFRCPECGSVIYGDINYCSRCGQRIY